MSAKTKEHALALHCNFIMQFLKSFSAPSIPQPERFIEPRVILTLIANKTKEV